MKKGKQLLWAGLVLLGVLLLWGSWEDPALHEYARPVQLLQLEVTDLSQPAHIATAREQVLTLPGVTACAINAKNHLVTVLFREGEVSRQEIVRVLSVGGEFAVTPLAPVAYPAATGRQCPVPPSYVAALEQVRFAFNLRRWLVAP